MHDSTVKTIVIVGGLAIGIMGIVALASSTDDPTPTPKSNQTILPTATPEPTVVPTVKPKPTDVHCTTTDVATGKFVVVSPGDRAVIGDSLSQCDSDGTWSSIGPADGPN